MNKLMQDLHFAWRQLRKSPGFTLTVVLTLALGIGANSAIFTLVHAILLKSLPVADPAQLYRLGDKDDCCINGGYINENGDFDIFSYDLYLHLRASAPEFEQITAMQAGHNKMNVRRGDSPARPETSQYVAGNFFSTLGVGVFAGRPLSAADDTPGAPPVAIISYQSWQADFASDPSMVGAPLSIQGQPFTIVGIAPPGFYGDRLNSDPPAIWIPLANEPVLEKGNSLLHAQDSNWLYAVGRLRPGTSRPALEAKLSAALRQWIVTRPAYTENGNSVLVPKQYIVLTPAGGGIQNLQQQTGKGLQLLMILSGLVLLIACANTANLLLARGASRRAETSIRMALGAGRQRLIRQMLTESVLLGCLGGLAGLAIAYAGSHLILSLAFPNSTNLPISASPSLPVLGFTFALSLLTGIIFGIAPAWMTSHAEPAEALRGANRSTRDRVSLPQRSLVVLQAALSLVLLAGAGLLAQSLRNLEHQNFGIATANRYVVHLAPDGAGYTPATLPALYQQLDRRFSALPGMKSVGLALYSPLEDDNWGDGIYVSGRPAPGPTSDINSSWDRISPGFFDSIGQPVLRGRAFTDQDTQTSRFVAVVNQTFVKYFFPNEDPIGKHFGIWSQENAEAFEIVGVVADAKYNNPNKPFRRMFFLPLTQKMNYYKDPRAAAGESRSMYIGSIILNFNGPQQGVSELVHRTLADIDPNLTIIDMRSLDYQVAGNFNQERLIARLTTLFGLLALVLASIGLYGVTAYSVAQRTSEIGVRMALGATRTSVIGMVLRGASYQVLLGLAIGIPATLICGHLIASQLYGVRAYEPLVLMVATLALALSAAIAGFIPARRAASIEPMQALRTE